jgi:hypothetical protein
MAIQIVRTKPETKTNFTVTANELSEQIAIIFPEKHANLIRLVEGGDVRSRPCAAGTMVDEEEEEEEDTIVVPTAPWRWLPWGMQ